MKENKGITIIALVITIILILTLAVITVNVTINGGLFGYAGKAKMDTEIASEKEALKKASIIAEGTSKTGVVTVDNMQKAINKVTKEDMATVMDNGDTIVVKFNDSNRYYEIDKKGNISEFTVYVDTTPGELALHEDGYYMIESIEDLVALSAMTNGGYEDDNIKISTNTFNGKTVCLMRDLNFKSSLSYNNDSTTIYNGYLGIENADETLIEALTNEDKYLGFIPLSKSKGFNGTFDGQGNSILNIYERDERAWGLFRNIWARVAAVTIKNLTISGNIYCTSENNCGGILGIASSDGDSVPITIEHCINKINIKTGASAGGIVGTWGGSSSSVIQNCCNLASINGNASVGGILGWGQKGSNIKNCYNLGSLSSSASTGNEWSATGGILGAGRQGTNIVNCYNLGTVTALDSHAGGMLGSFSYHTTIIKNCYNVGEVKAKSAGALIGGGYDGYSGLTVEGCYYLDSMTGWGIGTLSEEQATAGDDSFMKSNELVTALNNNIEIGESNTLNYCYWNYNKGNYPTIDFNKKWNGASWDE